MNFRYARHTNNLKPIIHFYTELLGFKILGNFSNHDNYDGVFLGLKDTDWHLEFTTSKLEANHKFDEDDLLVFYVDSQDELDDKVRKAKELNLEPIEPKNPYWKSNGIVFFDPDGVRIVIALKK